MSQNNHLPWQMFLSNALHWQITYQRGPSSFDQGNYNNQICNTQRIPLTSNLFDEQGLHAESASAFSTSFKIAPVNLDMNFAAEKLEENKVRLDSPDSSFASNKGIDDIPHKNRMDKVSVKNKFCNKYSIADAWINGYIAKYQWKLSGRRSADFKFFVSSSGMFHMHFSTQEFYDSNW